MGIPGTPRRVKSRANEYAFKRFNAGGQATVGDRLSATAGAFDIGQRHSPRVQVAGGKTGVNLVAFRGDVEIVNRLRDIQRTGEYREPKR